MCSMHFMSKYEEEYCEFGICLNLVLRSDHKWTRETHMGP